MRGGRVAITLSVAAVVLLAGCGRNSAVATPTATIVPTAPISPAMTPTRPWWLVLPPTAVRRTTPEIFYDCVFQIDVSAWLDLNADGIRDGDERALPGVKFILGWDSTITTRRDNAAFNIFNAGCGRVEGGEVYAEVPAGYRPTTATRATPRHGMLFEVGFAPTP